MVALFIVIGWCVGLVVYFCISGWWWRHKTWPRMARFYSNLYGYEVPVTKEDALRMLDDLKQQR